MKRNSLLGHFIPLIILSISNVSKFAEAYRKRTDILAEMNKKIRKVKKNPNIF